MDVTQIILIVFILLLVIAYPLIITRRNKKESQKLTEQTNSLKRGDKVLTTSGVYGTIVDLQMNEDKKIVTIETGTDKKKGYISVDAYAIYTVFSDEIQKAVEQKKAEVKKTELNGENKTETTEKEEVKDEVLEAIKKEDEVSEDLTNPNKKSRKSKTKKDVM